MNHLEQKELLERVDKIITWKLENLRSTIWNQMREVPISELEKEIDALRISAIFSFDTDSYVELQAEIGALINRMNNGRSIDAKTVSSEIIKKLIGDEKQPSAEVSRKKELHDLLTGMAKRIIKNEQTDKKK